MYSKPNIEIISFAQTLISQYQFCFQETDDQCDGITERYCSPGYSITIEGSTITINLPDIQFVAPYLPSRPAIIDPLILIGNIDGSGDFLTPATPASIRVDSDDNGSYESLVELTIAVSGNYNDGTLTGTFDGVNVTEEPNCNFSGELIVE